MKKINFKQSLENLKNFDFNSYNGSIVQGAEVLRNFLTAFYLANTELENCKNKNLRCYYFKHSIWKKMLDLRNTDIPDYTKEYYLNVCFTISNLFTPFLEEIDRALDYSKGQK